MDRAGSTAAAAPVPDVWIVALETDGGSVDRWVDLVGSWLDADERAAAAAKRDPADRHRAEAAHLALRAVLGLRLGVEPAEVELARAACPLCAAPHGRPVLAGAAGEATTFSLSRAGGYASVAVVDGRGAVGVDIECVPPRVDADDLDAALHHTEQRALADLSPAERDLGALRCWTRKEAVLKGWGTGLGVDPAELVVGPGTAPRVPGTAIATPVAPVHLVEHDLRRAGWIVADVGTTAPLAVALALGSNEPRTELGTHGGTSAVRLSVEVREVALADLLGDRSFPVTTVRRPGRPG